MQKKSSSTVKVYYPRYSKEELIDLLRRKLGKLKAMLPLKILALFGSQASGNRTVASDVDILVVYADPNFENAYSLVWDVLSPAIPQLQLHIFTASEYQKLEETSTFPREVKKGITIWENRA